MNLVRWLSPDYPLGRLLSRIKSTAELALQLAAHPSSTTWSIVRLIATLKPAYTMINVHGLFRLARLTDAINHGGINGNIVECGTWNGGSSALMAARCLAHPDGRRRAFWLYDSFEGLPEPSEHDGAQAGWYFKGWLVADPENIRRAFSRVGFPATQCHIVKGWFQDTLRSSDTGPIALLHIDADWYESVKICLDTFYDQVQPGGYVVFDDYGYFDGCNKAVDEFLARLPAPPALVRTGKVGAYFQKP
jgi:O-methyltransferase